MALAAASTEQPLQRHAARSPPHRSEASLRCGPSQTTRVSGSVRAECLALALPWVHLAVLRGCPGSPAAPCRVTRTVPPFPALAAWQGDGKVGRRLPSDQQGGPMPATISHYSAPSRPASCWTVRLRRRRPARDDERPSWRFEGLEADSRALEPPARHPAPGRFEELSRTPLPEGELVVSSRSAGKARNLGAARGAPTPTASTSTPCTGRITQRLRLVRGSLVGQPAGRHGQAPPEPDPVAPPTPSLADLLDRNYRSGRLGQAGRLEVRGPLRGAAAGRGAAHSEIPADARDDWLPVRATGDPGQRYTLLWTSGLLDRMPAEIDHAVVAADFDGQVGR